MNTNLNIGRAGLNKGRKAPAGRSRGRRWMAGLLAMAVAAALGAPAAAVELKPGDILVADSATGPIQAGAVIAIDPATGQQTIVADRETSGTDLFISPYGIAIDTTGRILVTDPDTGNVGGGDPRDSGAVIIVDPVSGGLSVLARASPDPADLLSAPQGIAIDAAGRILVVDPGAGGVPGGGVLAIAPISGQQTFVSNNLISGPDLFVRPVGIAIDHTGRILIADQDAGQETVDHGSGDEGAGAVIAVDPVTGEQTLISDNARSGPNLFADPVGIAVDAAGRILIADESSDATSFNNFRGAVIAVDPVTGEQSVVPGSDAIGDAGFSEPSGIAVDAAGRILVGYVDQGNSSPGTVFAIDPATGQVSLVAGNELFDPLFWPREIEIVP